MVPLLVYGALAIAGGYLAFVLAYLVLTFGLTSLAPKFVMHRGHFTSGYIFLHPIVWGACGVLGGYVTATIADASVMLILAAFAALAGIVIIKHGGATSRQTMRSKMVQAFLAVAGIAGGGYIALK